MQNRNEKEYRLNIEVNGFQTVVCYPISTVENVLLPLIRRIASESETCGRRKVVFLAGPPGSGKSTLAKMMEHLSIGMEGIPPLRTVGMDGFHYTNEELRYRMTDNHGKMVPLKNFKGREDTFDVEKLITCLKRVRDEDMRFPEYDRNIHDVVPDKIPVTEKILLVEGNYLLLNTPRWAEVRKLCDTSIFIRAEEKLLRAGLIERKMRGGLSRQEAEAYYERTDGPNVRVCLTQSVHADHTLRLLENHAIKCESD